jgi:hypothetical protein
MNLTSILVVINEYTNDISSIETNLKTAGNKVELFVYNNHCTNPKIISELKELSVVWIDNVLPFIYSYSECINELFKFCNSDYVCICREFAILSDNWLQKLIESHDLITNSGIISINDCSTFEGNYQLTKDYDLEWIYTNDFRINNFAFFSKDLIFKLGGLNPALSGKYSLWDYCDRAMQIGFFNYFVPNTSMIRLEEYQDDYIQHTIYEFNKRKHQQFFKIFNLSSKDKMNIQQLSKKFENSFTFNEKMGCIVFMQKDSFKLDFLLNLNKELEILNLTVEFFCSSFFEFDVLKSTFLGIIRNR